MDVVDLELRCTEIYAGLIDMVKAGGVPFLVKYVPEFAPPQLDGLPVCPEDFASGWTKSR